MQIVDIRVVCVRARAFVWNKNEKFTRPMLFDVLGYWLSVSCIRRMHATQFSIAAIIFLRGFHHPLNRGMVDLERNIAQKLENLYVRLLKTTDCNAICIGLSSADELSEETGDLSPEYQ